MKRVLIALFAAGFAALSLIADDIRPRRSITIGDTTAAVINAKSRIVVAPNASKATLFAASQLQEILQETFGARLEIVKVPPVGGDLILGDNQWSRSAGIDGKTLCRDAFIIRTVGGSVYILGIDDPKADLAKDLQGGAWNLQHQRGTLFGVYDFLERFAGVRLFFPGKIGTVIPKKSVIKVPQSTIYDRPDFTTRKVSTFYDGDWYEGEKRSAILNPARVLNVFQMRFETSYIPNCHGLGRMKYLERFGKSHPEYFALMSDGRRHNSPALPHSGQLCFSSGIREEIYQDAKAYLSGQPPETRGLKHWDPSAAQPGFFNIMPQDGMYGCCCTACKATNLAGPNYATDLIWNFTVELAKRLKREGVPGVLTQMAYRPYRSIPAVEIPDNVLVMVAENGPWGKYNPVGQKIDAAEIAAWRKKLRRKVWIWNYANKFGNRVMPGIPCPTPRAIAEYYRSVAPEIFGAYMESESDQFIFYYLNYYVFSKICWNNQTDVNALLADHYRAMFGPAATLIQQIFERYEDIWLKQIGGRVVDSDIGPVGAPPSDYELWNNVYSETVLAELRALYNQAELLAKNDPAALSRIRFIRGTHLNGIENGLRSYLASSNAVAAFRVPAGNKIQLLPLAGKGRATVKTTVDARKTDDTLLIRFECEEPETAKMVAAKRKFDDPELWRDNVVEIFLNPLNDRKRYCHILVNSAGALADETGVRIGASSQQDWSWNSEAKVSTGIMPNGWFAEIAIPLKNLPEWNGGAIPANFTRHRVLNDNSQYEPYYAWGPFVRGFHDLENFGTLDFGKKAQNSSILYNGDFSAPWKKGRAFGKMNSAANHFEGWMGPNRIQAVPPATLDRTNFIHAGAALRLENPLKGGHADGASVTQYLPQLKPDTKYRLSFFVKLENVRKTGKSSGVCANLWDERNNWFPSDNWLEGTTPWLFRSYEFRTSPNTGKKMKPYLRLCLHQATGIVWFDNVKLVELK